MTIETAAIVVLLLVVSGSMDQSNTTLVIMGFDPDRAQLITSLLIGAIAAATATALTGQSTLSTVVGLIAALALFGGTFLAETTAALGATGAYGAFDPGGWALTALALVVSGTVAAWAGAGLASLARPSILRATADLEVVISRRQVDRATLRYPLTVALILALLVVSLPAFGDLVNYAPDSLMRRGTAPEAALLPAATASSTPTTPTPTTLAAGASATSSSPSSGPSLDPKPWLRWLPTGAGVVSTFNMAAPWKGGSSNIIVSVYTPPGYDAKGTRRYPVLYEAPTGYTLWGGATNVKSALDTLIDSGALPAMIMVFIDSAGGPYPDSECADSYDHREWFDTFVGVTMVSWVDAHYNTIADAAARAIAGMSEGGYCAAILALHHPAVFGTSISFSGYYQAGGGGSSSAAPFGGNAALLKADSPTLVAGQLASALRPSLYFVLVAKPDQPGYGPDATGFAKTLGADGYPCYQIASTEPHGWPQVRDYFPSAVEAWAARMVTSGVFGSAG